MTDITSDQIYAVIERAAEELRELGMKDPAPYRAMLTAGLGALPGNLCTTCHRRDLLRLQAMVEHELAKLGPVLQ